jgi:hypothetical protein
MDQKEKRQLETALVKLGLAGLDSTGEPTAELVSQIAFMVDSWHPVENRMGEWVDKHCFLRDLLNECDADKRTDMYNAIAPQLKSFKPHSLAKYESMIAEKAGKLLSQRRARVTGDAPKPIEIGGNLVHIAPNAAEANCGWAIVKCHACEKVEKFLDITPVGAMTKARRAGWVRNTALQEETCPDCAAEEANAEVVTLARNQSLVVNDKRRVN